MSLLEVLIDITGAAIIGFIFGRLSGYNKRLREEMAESARLLQRKKGFTGTS